MERPRTPESWQGPITSATLWQHAEPGGGGPDKGAQREQQKCLAKTLQLVEAGDLSDAMAWERFSAWYKCRFKHPCPLRRAQHYWDKANQQFFHRQLKTGGLLALETDPYVLQGLILDGSNLWVAAPKTGKTRLALHVLRGWLFGEPMTCGRVIAGGADGERGKLNQGKAAWHCTKP